MLSRKNKELRTIKEGVVGKYVKKDTPPEMPSESYNFHLFVIPVSIQFFSNKRLDDRTKAKTVKSK